MPEIVPINVWPTKLATIHQSSALIPICWEYRDTNLIVTPMYAAIMHTMLAANNLENSSPMICFFIYWMSAAAVTSDSKEVRFNCSTFFRKWHRWYYCRGTAYKIYSVLRNINVIYQRVYKESWEMTLISPLGSPTTFDHRGTRCSNISQYAMHKGPSQAPINFHQLTRCCTSTSCILHRSAPTELSSVKRQNMRTYSAFECWALWAAKSDPTACTITDKCFSLSHGTDRTASIVEDAQELLCRRFKSLCSRNTASISECE